MTFLIVVGIVVVLIILVFVYACCRLSGKISEQEERGGEK